VTALAMPWRDIWRQDPVELIRAWRLRRRPHDLVDSVLDLLDGVHPALQAGLPPGRALELAAASSLGPDGLGRARAVGSRSGRSAASDIERLVGAALDAVEAGHSVSAVWAEWARRTASPELEFVAAAWRLSETTGAPLAAAVERAAHGLRDARARRGRVAVAVAGPRATVAVLTVLPLTGPLFGLACGIDPASLYARSPITMASLGVGLVLIWTGRSWCRRLIRSALSS
jgi:tight adherence protein B